MGMIDKKIALIVEGGGFKSAFTAGVLDAFMINGFNHFDLYLGISGGAMNLTSFISNQYKRNYKIIKEMSHNAHFISIIRFLKGGNYLELKYMLEVASKKYPFNIEKANLNLSGKECKFVVTNYETGKPAYLSVKKYGWIKTIEATGSLPIATRGFCEIAEKKYIDGGLSDPLPVKRVYDWGYRKVILLRTNPKAIMPDWNLESLYAPLFYRDNPRLRKLISRNDKIYAKAQKYVDNHPSDLKLIHLAPKDELKCGVISSTKEYVHEDYLSGMELALDSLPKLRRFAKNSLMQ